MKKALVSGANGFVGAAVVKELAANGYEVFALARKNHNDHIPMGDNIHFIPFELENAEQLKAVIPADTYEAFYHFAWSGSAGNARANTRLQLQNAQWTISICNLRPN